MSSNKILGNIGESKSCNYLLKSGYELLFRNFRCRYGEIDIVAKNGNIISFIEVKTRSGTLYGNPEESIDNQKKIHIKNTANYYIQQAGLEDYEISFDVISIISDGRKFKLKHLKNCF